MNCSLKALHPKRCWETPVLPGMSQGAQNLPFGCLGPSFESRGFIMTKPCLGRVSPDCASALGLFCFEKLESPYCAAINKSLEKWGGRGGWRLSYVSAVPLRRMCELWLAGERCTQCFPNQFAFTDNFALGASRASPFPCCKKSD